MTKKIFLVAAICTFAHLHICTFAQVANGTGAGNCLSYDGIGNYVAVNDADNLTTSSALTISCWIKPFSFTGSCGVNHSHIVIKWDDATPGYEYHFNLINNKLAIYLNLNTVGIVNVTGNTNLTVNDWTHVTATWDGCNIILYVNGQIDNTGTQCGVINNTSSKVGIGRKNQGYVCPFNGQIDEVRIWNRALTQTEIQTNMCKKLTGSESGLVGYWRFDEGSGSTVYDASGNGNNGTLY